MTLLKYVLLSVFFITLPFVENAPSNMKNTRNDELDIRLVFVDKRDDKAVTSNFERKPIPMAQKSSISNTISSGPVFAPNNPPLVDNLPYRPSPGLPRMDDERQNWGFIVDDKDLTEDESYYNRPLSIPKYIDTKVTKNEKVAKNHSKNSSKPPEILTTKPGACDAAVITCCANLSQANNCFKSKGCVNVTQDMFSKVCSKDYILKVITNMAEYYKGPSEN